MEELILKEREVREKIAEIINNSGLPAFVLKTIIKEFYEQLNVIEQQQYGEALNNRENIKGKEQNNGKD